MSTGYICDRCGATFTDGGKWLQDGYHGSTAFEQHWDLCPDCMDSFAGWMERGQIADMSEKSADCVRDGGEMSELEHDTREKLEADVYRAADNMDAMCNGERFLNTHMIFRWLDRQASITEREVEHALMMAGHMAVEIERERITELCDQVDALKAKLDAEAQHAREAWRLWGEADVKLERMTVERDQWKDAYEDSERMRLALVDDLDKRDMGIERLERRRGELMERVRSLQDELARVRRMG